MKNSARKYLPENNATPQPHSTYQFLTLGKGKENSLLYWLNLDQPRQHLVKTSSSVHLLYPPFNVRSQSDFVSWNQY